MKHIGTKSLTTDRLILRRFTMEDAQGMYDNWASDTEVTKFLTWQTHNNIEISKEILKDWTNHYEEEDYYNWAIALKEDEDNPIGGIAVVNKNEKINMVHIGYCIGRKWWNQGIVSEALDMLIDFFINTVEVNRVEARYDPNNPNSGKVMAKCAMKYEGTMKEADWNNQGICDTVMYALLAKDYRQTK